MNLQEQMRTTDRQWMETLQRLREGECDEADLTEVRKLVLGNEGSTILDFGQPPWDNVILVTPRHGVRVQWNHATLVKHCLSSGQRLYIFPAEDTVGVDHENPYIHDQVTIAGSKPSKTACLDNEVKMAIGMKVMVVLNLATKGDLANGTRGTIEDILLYPREPTVRMDDETGMTHLKFPPTLVLFKPAYPTQTRFEGIPAGLIPISPSEREFRIKDINGKDLRVTRRQLALTPTYAFTDYKAQGQTIAYVIIDIGKPPSGGLTAFNAYVALSRSRGRESIRLLRNFEDEILTHHPSEDLGIDDIRVKVLAEAVREKLAEGQEVC